MLVDLPSWRGRDRGAYGVGCMLLGTLPPTDELESQGDSTLKVSYSHEEWRGKGSNTLPPCRQRRVRAAGGASSEGQFRQALFSGCDLQVWLEFEHLVRRGNQVFAAAAPDVG